MTVKLLWLNTGLFVHQITQGINQVIQPNLFSSCILLLNCVKMFFRYIMYNLMEAHCFISCHWSSLIFTVNGKAVCFNFSFNWISTFVNRLNQSINFIDVLGYFHKCNSILMESLFTNFGPLSSFLQVLKENLILFPFHIIRKLVNKIINLRIFKVIIHQISSLFCHFSFSFFKSLVGEHHDSSE